MTKGKAGTGARDIVHRRNNGVKHFLTPRQELFGACRKTLVLRDLERWPQADSARHKENSFAILYSVIARKEE